MSRKFKSQASSARAATAAFGSPSFGFGGPSTGSSLSYIAEQPDLSTLSDPNVVVSLRNLGKKDSTTKAKALEELQEHVKTVGPNVEDGVISAWVSLPSPNDSHDQRLCTCPRIRPCNKHHVKAAGC
jgi:E3 ubiquitin-protein ligase listerin